jgi:hypothetical protein
MVVAEMATTDLDGIAYPDLVNILNAFTSERNCGSVFPDWAWPSFYQQYSRIAHTVEFQQAWADYAKDNFQPPYTVNEKREISFFMGLTVHTYADPPWHTFFLPEAKAHDDAGHGLTEIGTDIFANWELGKREEVTYGYFPAATAIEVYSIMGYPEVTESMVLKGMLILRAAYWLEKTVGYSGYLNLIQGMPWTDQNYLSYAPGGFEYDAEVSAPEMVNTWNYIQDDFNQLQLRDMPVCVESDILVDLGRRLLESGAIEIPVERTEQGEYFLGEPRIVDRQGFESITKP